MAAPLKLVIRHADKPPTVINDGQFVQIVCGEDVFGIWPHGDGGILVRIEEHADRLASHLAVFPEGGNSVRLKGGLR